MRFTEGVWGEREDIAVHSAVEAVEVSSTLASSSTPSIPIDSNAGPYVRALCATRHIRHRGDLLNKPLIRVTLTAPAPGVIGVEAAHWFGASPLKEPRVKLFPHGSPKDGSTQIEVVDKASASIVTPGGIARAVIDLRDESFSVQFYNKQDYAVTGLGYQSIQWILNRAASPGLHEKENAAQTIHDYYYRAPATRRQGYMALSTSLAPDEKVYGFGERFGPFIKNGQTIESSNDDGGTSSNSAYKAIPFYLTNRNYGVYFDHQDCVSYEVQSDRMTKVQASVPGETIRAYYIFGDSPKEVLTRYTQLTGRPPLPPDWSYGLWLSTSFLTGYDQKSVMSYIDGMAEHLIPLSVFHFDCYWMRASSWCDFQFDPEFFPDPKAFLKEIHQRGIKVCVWINHWVAQNSRLFPEGDAKGYFLKRLDGRTFQTDEWQPGVAYVDYTNPAAVKWWQKYLAELLDLGVDTFKTDFGERIVTEDIKYHDGSDPSAMHNHYALLYNKAVWDVLVEKRGASEACLFARAATTGTQQYPVHWGGDVDSEWTGMAETIRACLSFGLSGFGYHSSDIGGFKGEGKTGGYNATKPPAAVYKRWCQMGLLTTHSRLHGSGTPRVPWIIDEEACQVLSQATILKCRLEPYFTNASIAGVVKQGHPVVRAMFLEFPQDPTCWSLDLQFMLGSDLLVAPVLSEKAVTYYLPAGKWTNLLTGQEYTGPMWISEDHDMFSLPVLLRQDRILVIGKEGHSVTDSITDKGFTVVIPHSMTGSTEQALELRKGKRLRVRVDIDTSGQAIVKLSEGKAPSFEVAVIGGAIGLSGAQRVQSRAGAVTVRLRV